MSAGRFVHQNGQQAGPFTATHLKQMAQPRTVVADSAAAVIAGLTQSAPVYW
jgi:hypothetical protein